MFSHKSIFNKNDLGSLFLVLVGFAVLRILIMTLLYFSVI